MWQLYRPDAAGEWESLGLCASLSDAARKIASLESYDVPDIVISSFVPVAGKSDDECLACFHVQGRQSVYIIERN